MNIDNIHLGHIFMSTLFRERLIHLPCDFILTFWLNVCAVAGHGAVLAALLLPGGDNFHELSNPVF